MQYEQAAQTNNLGYFIGITKVTNKSLPYNAYWDIPIFIDREKTLDDIDGWYQGYIPRRSTDKLSWEYVKNFKDKLVYDGVMPVIWKHYGTLTEGYYEEPLGTENQIRTTVKSERDKKYIDISNTRQIMWDSGIMLKGYVFQSRQKDKENVLNFLSLVKNYGWTFGETKLWRSEDDLMIPLTFLDFVLYEIKLNIQNEIVYTVSWRDKDYLEKLSDTDIRSLSKIREFKPTLLNKHQLDVLVQEQLDTVYKEELLKRGFVLE